MTYFPWQQNPGLGALRQTATQHLHHAYSIERGGSALSIFAAKHMPNLSPEQQTMRTEMLRLPAALVETEFVETMDKLCEAWKVYRETEANR